MSPIATTRFRLRRLSYQRWLPFYYEYVMMATAGMNLDALATADDPDPTIEALAVFPQCLG